MLTLTQCWFTRKHTPSEPVPRSGKDVFHSHCKSCDRPIISWDRSVWHLAEGFNLLQVYRGLNTSFLYLVDTRVDVVVARFTIDHLKTEPEIAAYARQICADNGVDDPDSVLELRDSRKGNTKPKGAKNPAGTSAPAAAAPPPAADADRLTGLPGRGTFETAFATECSRAQAQNARLTVAFVDIDQLDRYNRAHGLDAGDAAVQFVAAQLAGLGECQCHISRNRGLEFILLFRGAGADLAQSRLENVRKLIAGSKLPEAPDQPLSVSCGLSEIQADGDPRTALRSADVALHHAKAHGRNTVIAGECDKSAGSAKAKGWLGRLF